ncbi:MAG: DNA adenine methylase [Clostridia bacterium]|nr:DNA adenine methylase [Clostridia bacterium]
MKTFVKYPGGKTNELEIINKNKPCVIKRYFEPFVGGGSVFFDLEVPKSYINDASEDLISLYTLIQNHDEIFLEMLQKLNDTWKKLSVDNYQNVDFLFISNNPEITSIFLKYKIAEDERKEKKIKKIEESGVEFNGENVAITCVKAAFYCTIRYIYNTEKTDKRITALTYYFLREFCYSSMFRFSSTGKFNVPYGGSSYNHKNFDAKIKTIKEYRIEKAKIYNEDFGKFLKRFKFNSEDFIFVDPPYDSEFSNYDGKEFDKSEQIRLAQQLSESPAKVMIIIKNTDFIYELYSKLGFKIKCFDKKYSVNFNNRNSRDVVHLLITNY